MLDVQAVETQGSRENGIVCSNELLLRVPAFASPTFSLETMLQVTGTIAMRMKRGGDYRAEANTLEKSGRYFWRRKFEAHFSTHLRTCLGSGKAALVLRPKK